VFITTFGAHNSHTRCAYLEGEGFFTT